MEDQLTQRFIANHESDEAYIDMLFGRVNNSYIHRLTLSFRPENRLRLYHLRSHANHLQCQVRALRIDATAERIDYGLVDFLGVHLEPQVFETSMTREFREDYAMLFACNALRGNVKHLAYELYGPSTPDCIFPELFGVGAIQTCTFITEIDPRPWIGSLVRVNVA
ncbi:hypothetical protein AAVH_18610 [Aphelenchoides avenae]|nr:hypothetical protein AAVH_18610 [Aphelenchus avenae]